jgi:hypothetical protein
VDLFGLKSDEIGFICLQVESNISQYFRCLMNHVGFRSIIGLDNLRFHPEGGYRGFEELCHNFSDGYPLAKLDCRKIRCYGIEDTIEFGKYRTKYLSEIVVFDPSYLVWLVVNLSHFCLESDIFLRPEIKCQKECFLAFEINEAKLALISEWVNRYHHIQGDSEIDDLQGDWGGLYDDEASLGYWNTY